MTPNVLGIWVLILIFIMFIAGILLGWSCMVDNTETKENLRIIGIVLLLINSICANGLLYKTWKNLDDHKLKNI